MANDDRVTQQNTTSQQEGQTSHGNPNVQPELSELDAEQAFLCSLKFVIDAAYLVEPILVQRAMDDGKPEMAEQIKSEFIKLLRSKLLDTLSQSWDEFKQLWPELLQPILCEIKSHGFGVIDLHWSQISEVLDSMRKDSYISPQICNEEILADILQGDKIARQVPPGHSILHLLGVANEGEWNKLTMVQQQTALIRVLTEAKDPFLKKAIKLIHRWAEDSSTNSVSQERMVHGDEVLETIKDKSGGPQEYLSDAERLSQLLESKDIDFNELTDADRNRLMGILHRLHTGHDFASKTGFSMAACDGDRADSEKTQRQRLFKKLRDTQKNVK